MILTKEAADGRIDYNAIYHFSRPQPFGIPNYPHILIFK